MKRGYHMLCAAVILATIAMFIPTRTMADVTIGDKTWRQLTETTNVNWNDLNVIYDTTDGKLDAGTMAGGHDFTGWTWASETDVAEMFTASHATLSIGIQESVYEEDSAWAPNIFTNFTPTNPGVDNWLGGITRSVSQFESDKVWMPYIVDFGTGLDLAETDIVGNKTSTSGARGAWLYKSASVPEPGFTTLLGIALVGLVAVGVVGKFKKRREKKGYS